MSQPRSQFWTRKRFRSLLTILIFVLIFFSVRAYQQRGLVSAQAPALAGTTVTGQPVDLASIDRPKLVYFWATWCPVCKLEKGAIQGLAQDYPVVSVAMQSPVEDVVRYLDEAEFDVPVLLDQDGSIAARFGVRAVPAMFVVSSQGDIAFTEVGYTTGLGLRLRMMLTE